MKKNTRTPTPAQLAKRIAKLESRTDQNFRAIKAWMRETERTMVFMAKRIAAITKARKAARNG